MDGSGADHYEADLGFWHKWTGVPESDAHRNEAIERFRRLTEPEDPDGRWDRCRLSMAKELAHRAGFGMITGWAEAPSTGQGWLDAAEALKLFAITRESKTLDATLRNQARIAHARLATGMAILRGANALFTGRIPDVRAIRAHGEQLPEDDEYKPTVPIVTGLIDSMLARGDDSSIDQRQALGELTEGVAKSAPEAPWRRMARNVLSIVTGMAAATDPAGVPAERIETIAAEGLAAEGEDGTEAGVFHALTFLARYSRAIASGEPPTDEQTLAELEQASESLPPDHPLRQMLPAFAYNVMSERYAQTGALADRDAAEQNLRTVQGLDEWRRLLAGEASTEAEATLLARADFSQPGVIGGLVALDAAARALKHGNPEAAGRAITECGSNLATLDPENKWQPILAAGLGECLAFRHITWPAAPDETSEIVKGLRLVIDAAARAEPDVPFHGHFLAERGARAQAELGRLTGDREPLDAAIASLETGTGLDDAPGPHRARQLLLLGQIRCDRYLLAADRRDLDDGIEAVREAERTGGDQPGPLRSALLWTLATALRLRGDLAGEEAQADRALAIDTGLTALEELAVEVLLQTGAGRGIEAAKLASARSAAVAAWCIGDGQPEQAVQALELGRGLVLHATTVAADVPALLHAAGRDELVPLWKAGLARSGPLPWDGPRGAAGGELLLPRLTREDLAIPSDVRYRVFTALRDAAPDAAWLTRPAVAELAGALALAGADAFVYLVPPGSALVVTATGAELIPLPRLAGSQVTGYNAAQLRWNDSPDDDAARADWHEALEDTCDWAWDAVTAPVLRQSETWGLTGPARLVLIPTGDLGGVPWHAARTRASKEPGSRPHYAIDEAVFSYAATARQFARAAANLPARWNEQPLIIANPTGDLKEAAIEAAELRRRYYPHAEVLGQLPDAFGAGSAVEVLSRLPGGTGIPATLLHCGCHATVANSLADSHLVLAGGEKLTIAEIVAQAERRGPDQPGFLAVLGSCLSDLADVDHDEALTLASALLAAGAAGVVGARWPVEDLPMAQLLVMFHHYLSEHADSPASALRAAQLWMLDEDRAGLEDLPAELAGKLDSRDYRAVHNWAALTYQGR